ncbi:MAG TPA: ABC transporter permease, partial [Lachnospiraceae bacterium]|nr:ABC transporter permease [Lachnospiraceae bacterium]
MDKKAGAWKRFMAIRGMGSAVTAFVGLIVIYVAFGIINPTVFSGENIGNLSRSMSKYLLVGIGQSFVMITGNIDLSIGSLVGMCAMISATLM